MEVVGDGQDGDHIDLEGTIGTMVAVIVVMAVAMTLDGLRNTQQQSN